MLDHCWYFVTKEVLDQHCWPSMIFLKIDVSSFLLQLGFTFLAPDTFSQVGNLVFSVFSISCYNDIFFLLQTLLLLVVKRHIVVLLTVHRIVVNPTLLLTAHPQGGTLWWRQSDTHLLQSSSGFATSCGIFIWDPRNLLSSWVIVQKVAVAWVVLRRPFWINIADLCI